MAVVEVPGVNTAATPCSRSASASALGIVPPTMHEHVVGALLAQQLEDARDERHVRAREDGDADRVGILLHDGLHDLLGRLVQAGVDDLHTGIAKRPGDDLGSAIVAIESRLRNDHADPACHPPDCMRLRPPSGPGERGSILYALTPVTDRTDPYEIIGVRRDASLAEIRISYRRSTQILAPERFANANDTVRAEAARRLSALNGAMEAIEAERAAESGSALGSLTFAGPAVSPAAEPSMRSIAIVDEPPPLAPPAQEPDADGRATAAGRRGRRGRRCPRSRQAVLPEPEESTAPVELEPRRNRRHRSSSSRSRPSPTDEVPVAREADTEDDLLPSTPGEDTGEVPLIDLEPAPVAAATPAPQRFERPAARGEARALTRAAPARRGRGGRRARPPSASTSCSAAGATRRPAGSSRPPARP